jgi:membrane protein
MNAALRKIPGLRGSVRRLEVYFIRPVVAAKGISLVTCNGTGPGHRIEMDLLKVSSEWKTLLGGSLVASLEVDAPRLLLRAGEIQGSRGEGATTEQKSKRDNESPTRLKNAGPAWQEKVMQLPHFKVASATVRDGEVRIAGLTGQNGTELSIQHLNIRAENIANSDRLKTNSMARVSADAGLPGSGTFQLQAQGYPLAKVPTFNADLSSRDIDLTALQELIESAVDVKVRRGFADLFVEAAAANGYIRGYAKPIFDKLELEEPQHRSFFVRLKAFASKTLVWLFKNKRKDRIATRLNFEGRIDDPGLDVFGALIRFIRNAFGTAERASLEHRIRFLRRDKTANEVIIRDLGEPRGRVSVFFALTGQILSRWSADGTPRMAAALSYYTTFSMAPLLILAISVAGLVLGRDAAQGKILEQIGGLIGPKSAAAIQDMLKGAASRRAGGIIASLISIVTLIAGATGVLSELKSALNIIWRTEGPGNVKAIIKKNALFLGMLLGIGFLMTVSLIVSAALASLGKFLSGSLPAPEIILHIIDFIFATGIIAVLFAAMYRFLPDTRVQWRDVWIGGVVTSLLFNIGKLGLGLYIGKSAVASSYGAAGSILVLLMWIYYSGLIFYFGAEFTKVYTDRYGSRLKRNVV